MKRLLLMLICAAGFLVVHQAAANAADFTVNSNGDAVDAAPGNGTCATAGGVCTLRAAVMEAEALAGRDVIAVPPMTITLESQLLVTKSVRIRGAGARSTIITSTPNHVMFNIGGGDVDLQDLAMQGARTTTGGGGLAVYQTANAATTLTRVRVVDNRVTGAATAYGPILLTAGEITITDSEISGNSAVSTSVNALGGALYVANAGTRATIVNSTIHSNSATAASNGFGGGIMTFAGTTVVIKSSTISNNVIANSTSISATGGNLYAGGSVTIENSIVAGGVAGLPTSANCSGAPTSVGRNIITDTTCGGPSVNRVIANPQLGALADNGGPTNSALPASTSPAVDGATSCATTADQRGQARPIGAACDIGSTEIGADLSVTQSVSNPNPRPGSDVVFTVNATNASLDEAPDASLSTRIDGAAQIVSTSGSAGSCSVSGQVVTCTVGSVQRGGNRSLSVVVRVPESGTVTSTATVSSPLVDPNPADNTAVTTATVPGQPGTTPGSSTCSNPIKGTKKADRLNGGPNGDRIRGLAGNDRIKGRGGNDCLFGEGGNDILVGGPGKDRISGGAGSDVVRAKDGTRDVIKCGAGRDLVIADKIDRVMQTCERVRRR